MKLSKFLELQLDIAASPNSRKKIDAFLEPIKNLEQKFYEENTSTCRHPTTNKTIKIVPPKNFREFTDYIEKIENALSSIFDTLDKGVETDEIISKYIKEMVYIPINYLCIADGKGVDLLFSHSNLFQIKFKECWFQTELYFDYSKFSKNISFEDVAFDEITNFENCTFHQGLKMERCSFNKDLKFNKAIFYKECTLKRSSIDGELSFNNATFISCTPNIRSLTGETHLNFNYATLKDNNSSNINNLKIIRNKLVKQGDSELARIVHNWEMTSRTYEACKNIISDTEETLYILKKGREQRTKDSQEIAIKKSLPLLASVYEQVCFIILSTIYWLFNKRGTSILFPIIWLSLGTFLMALFCYQSNIINTPHQSPYSILNNNLHSEYYQNRIIDNWENELRAESPFVKALFYSAQTSFWPAKFLSSGEILSITSIKVKIASLIHSLIATILWYLMIIRIKRRFQIDGIVN